MISTMSLTLSSLPVVPFCTQDAIISYMPTALSSLTPTEEPISIIPLERSQVEEAITLTGGFILNPGNEIGNVSIAVDGGRRINIPNVNTVEHPVHVAVYGAGLGNGHRVFFGFLATKDFLSETVELVSREGGSGSVAVARRMGEEIQSPRAINEAIQSLGKFPIDLLFELQENGARPGQVRAIFFEISTAYEYVVDAVSAVSSIAPQSLDEEGTVTESKLSALCTKVVNDIDSALQREPVKIAGSTGYTFPKSDSIREWVAEYSQRIVRWGSILDTDAAVLFTDVLGHRFGAIPKIQGVFAFGDDSAMTDSTLEGDERKKLIDDFLKLNRARIQCITHLMEAVEKGVGVNDISVSEMFRKYGIDTGLEVHIPEELPVFRSPVDAAHWETAVEEIVWNAFKHHSQSVTVWSDGKTLYVGDDGHTLAEAKESVDSGKVESTHKGVGLIERLGMPAFEVRDPIGAEVEKYNVRAVAQFDIPYSASDKSETVTSIS